MKARGKFHDATLRFLYLERVAVASMECALGTAFASAAGWTAYETAATGRPGWAVGTAATAYFAGAFVLGARHELKAAGDLKHKDQLPVEGVSQIS
jgi:hypothetical protein